jgi:putative membrane protein insertion efficiency factor
LALALLVVDLTRAPADQLTAGAAVAAVRGFSATFGRIDSAAGVRCRFAPTCSVYAELAIRRHGMVRGSMLTLQRLVRCGPWTPRGTHDPPPPVP